MTCSYVQQNNVFLIQLQLTMDHATNLIILVRIKISGFGV